MKGKKDVFYFPVDANEQALLQRVRELGIGHRDDLLDILDLVVEARVTAADLEQAIQLLVQSRQGEGLDARFDNLEARMKERIEKGLTEIEGRLSKRLVVESAVAPASSPSAPQLTLPASTSVGPLLPAPTQVAVELEVPREATLALRVGSELLWGQTAVQFYTRVWRWLFERGHVRLADLPIASGKIRYAVATQPRHPSGKNFTRAEQVVPGVYLEMNMSRDNIYRVSRKYLDRYGVQYDIVVGAEA